MARKKENIHGLIPAPRSVDFALYGWCHMCAKFFDYNRREEPGVSSIELTCVIRRSFDRQCSAWPEQWNMSDGGIVCKDFAIDRGKEREYAWVAFCRNRLGRPDPCYQCEYSRRVKMSGEWKCAHPENRSPQRHPEITVTHVSGRQIMTCDVGRQNT